MGNPHKHAEVIKAWANGKEIEVLYSWESHANLWRDVGQMVPNWCVTDEYRIKPEKVYPVTLMTDDFMLDLYLEGKGKASECLRRFANAAIRHAIDSGQVVLPTKEGE